MIDTTYEILIQTPRSKDRWEIASVIRDQDRDHVVLGARKLAAETGIRRVKVLATQSDGASGQVFESTIFDSRTKIEGKIGEPRRKHPRQIDFRSRPADNPTWWRSLKGDLTSLNLQILGLSVILASALAALWLSLNHGGLVIAMLWR